MTFIIDRTGCHFIECTFSTKTVVLLLFGMFPDMAVLACFPDIAVWHVSRHGSFGFEGRIRVLNASVPDLFIRFTLSFILCLSIGSISSLISCTHI